MRRPPLIATAVTAGALLLAGVSVTALADPSDGDVDTELLQQRVDELADAAGVGVIAEVRDGDEIFSGAAGARDIDGDEAAEPSDNVRVGSITKSMVTTVFMQLVEDGKVSLDTPIDEVLPGGSPYEEEVTVEHLLTHTSGIPDFVLSEIYPSLQWGSLADLRNNRDNDYTPAELVELVSGKGLDGDPGVKYAYSNTNYVLIGMIIENLTGSTLEDEIDTRVFEAADMSDSYTPRSEHALKDPFMHAYFSHITGAERLDTTKVSPTQMWASGSTVSNPGDINKFYRSLLSGELVSDESLDKMRTFTEQSEGEYGMGMESYEVGAECKAIPGGTAQGHGGGTLGHTSASFHSPDGDRQMTFTLGIDPQSLPPSQSRKVYDAAEALYVAGLCNLDSAPESFKLNDLDPQPPLPEKD